MWGFLGGGFLVVFLLVGFFGFYVAFYMELPIIPPPLPPPPPHPLLCPISYLFFLFISIAYVMICLSHFSLANFSIKISNLFVSVALSYLVL